MDIKYSPDAEHTFMLYSEGSGLTFWKTAQERDEYAKDEIRTYLDDGEWSDEVERVFAGNVTAVVRPCNVKERPEQLDEDGYDEDGDHWEHGVDYRCDYALASLGDGKDQGAA